MREFHTPISVGSTNTDKSRPCSRYSPVLPPGTILCYLATTLSDIRAADLATNDLTLALARWPPGTVSSCLLAPRNLSRAALKYPELSAGDLLFTHIRILASRGQTSGTIRGTLSAVQLCEKLELLPTVVSPRHWAMAAGSDRVYR